MHGTADTRLPITHVEHAHAAIAGSELRRIDGGGHTSFLFRTDLQREAVTWLHDHQSRQQERAPLKNVVQSRSCHE